MLVPAYVFGSVMAASMALATVAFTASAELAQITVAPFFLAAITSAAWVLSAEAGAVSADDHAGRRARRPRPPGLGGRRPPLPPIAGLLAWTGVGYAVSTRWLRWEPRR